MKNTTLGLTALLLTSGSMQAQDLKLTAIVDVWYTQMLDNNLRLNTPSAKYYPLLPAFQENGFSVRRTELWLNGSVTQDVS